MRARYSMTRGYVSRIHLWPIWRDERSSVLIGAGGSWRSGWPIGRIIEVHQTILAFDYEKGAVLTQNYASAYFF